jgi:hypothetical protein
VNDARALFDEYRPSLSNYFLSSMQGRFMLDVSDDSVAMVTYGGDSPEPSCFFLLRG